MADSALIRDHRSVDIRDHRSNEMRMDERAGAEESFFDPVAMGLTARGVRKRRRRGSSADYFLKIEGIEGESHDHKHKGEIEVDAFEFEVAQTGTHSVGGGGGAGRVRMGDFHFVMKANKASPRLFLACAIGQHFAKAVFTARKAGGQQQEFYKWTFSDLLVPYFKTQDQGEHDPIPVEHVTLNFARIEAEYREQKADGSLAAAVRVGYDLRANKMV